MIFPYHITEVFMPRKSTSNDTPSPDNTNITPDAPATEASTAVAERPTLPPADPVAAEQPVAEGAVRRSFADRVGQKQQPSAPDPFAIATDAAAGVKLYESKQDRQMAIKFAEKPSQAVLDKMREARWQWKQADRIWARPVNPGSALSTRIEAEQLFQEVRKMVRQEKGLEPGPEVPF
jgi:hypothetical protein